MLSSSSTGQKISVVQMVLQQHLQFYLCYQVWTLCYDILPLTYWEKCRLVLIFGDHGGALPLNKYDLLPPWHLFRRTTQCAMMHQKDEVSQPVSARTWIKSTMKVKGGERWSWNYLRHGYKCALFQASQRHLHVHVWARSMRSLQQLVTTEWAVMNSNMGCVFIVFSGISTKKQNMNM